MYSELGPCPRGSPDRDVAVGGSGGPLTSRQSEVRLQVTQAQKREGRRYQSGRDLSLERIVAQTLALVDEQGTDFGDTPWLIRMPSPRRNAAARRSVGQPPASLAAVGGVDAGRAGCTGIQR